MFGFVMAFKILSLKVIVLLMKVFFACFRLSTGTRSKCEMIFDKVLKKMYTTN